MCFKYVNCMQIYIGMESLPSNATIIMINKSRSLQVDASVKKKGHTTTYFYKANKLPGEINPDKCTIEVGSLKNVARFTFLHYQ